MLCLTRYTCQWISTFYKDIKLEVAVNGFLFRWVVDRGGPISPYLFVLCVEILAIMIRQNKNVIGISIGETEHKTSQYADDTEIMLEGDKNHLKLPLKPSTSLEKGPVSS